jgi:hypothetical protein
LPSAVSVFFGTFLNAASVGANTVYGPFAESVSARPACLTSETSVVKLPAATAVSTMLGLAAAAVAGRALAGAAASASAATPATSPAVARRAVVMVLMVLLWW